ncbi:hypothetical protein EST38_g4884 [Candolleomyces aberdarensis]|uniref:Uncharacterized protein n=1 Tax=Candolleomyces aberdarensis TaxID=2316362 RepID=A0A4Q2DNT8_9AGAR|nr:hypothetical protein EST38_g9945 [Candolleomyces aberdarensis]RXW20971.1 hypothetical protein EST38_g4884 [Candolleomyces aberdarensis]
MAFQPNPGPPARPATSSKGLKPAGEVGSYGDKWRMIRVVNKSNSSHSYDRDIDQYGALPFPSGTYEETVKACIHLFTGNVSSQKRPKLKVLVLHPDGVGFSAVWATILPEMFEEIIEGIPADKRIIGVFW